MQFAKKILNMQTLNSTGQKIHIEFQEKEQFFNVAIHTERLLIRPYQEQDFENSLAIYGNQELVKLFDHGKSRNLDEVKILVSQGTDYFMQGKPFGLFSIFSKEHASLIGHIDLFPTNEPGTVEVGYILDFSYQGFGYGTEAVRAIIFDYIQELNKRGFRVKEEPISQVIATVHPNNVSSQKIIEKMGMKLTRSQPRFGNPRLWYSLSL